MSAGDSDIFFALGFVESLRDDWLEVFYPEPVENPDQEMLDCLFTAKQLRDGVGRRLLIKDDLYLLAGDDRERFRFSLARSEHYNHPNRMIACFCRRDATLNHISDAYLKLHLLSHRMVRPNSVNLDNIFEVLPTVAWSSKGAFSLDEARRHQIDHRSVGKEEFHIYSIDKFPPMLNYVIPSGVRIADSARVRLGAYLGEGTTVMPAAFVNYNAGCEGPNMIEGRVSQGVMIGAGSDLGGGASTMGTLSGGNDQVITIGNKCLIGANAGIGISLGDNCIVEAGLYVTAGAKVKLLVEGQQTTTVKARELSGHSNLLWRRNSETGQLECLANDKNFNLNRDLHTNN